MILLIVLFGLALFIDHATKWMAVLYLKGQDVVAVIPPRVLELTYTENFGVTGGAFSGNRVATLIVPILGIIALVVYLFTLCPKQKRYRIPIVSILAGGFGNIIDRVFQGYVVDFISVPWFPWVEFKPFRFVDFPIFNVADIFVTIGALTLIVVLVIDLVKEGKAAKAKKAEAGASAEEQDHVGK